MGGTAGGAKIARKRALIHSETGFRGRVTHAARQKKKPLPTYRGESSKHRKKQPGVGLNGTPDSEKDPARRGYHGSSESITSKKWNMAREGTLPKFPEQPRTYPGKTWAAIPTVGGSRSMPHTTEDAILGGSGTSLSRASKVTEAKKS